MKRLLLLALVAAGLGAASNLFAAGIIIIMDQPGWTPPTIIRPRPPVQPWQPPQPHPFAPLEINNVKLVTKITDQVALTTVDEEFYNPNAARLEGTFLFPVPKGAQLDKFSMEIDGKKVEAELLAADKARGIYEDIVRKMRDPALLEYADEDVFKVRIFPIEPNSKKRVTLSYTQLLKADNGLISYSLPLGTEKYAARPIKNVSVKVSLETTRPLKTIYSPTYNVEVRRDGPNRATAGYEASEVQPEADFALYFAPENDDIGVNLLTYRRDGEDGYFLLLVAPGADMADKNVVPKDVAFVLDTSGSMSGKKIEQARKALQFCVNSLNDSDHFEILRFSTEVEPVFNDLVPASKENRQKATDFIKDLRANGGTAIDDALQAVLKLRAKSEEASRPFAVVFLTDGQPTIGNTDEKQIVAHVKEAAGRARIFCFGIGSDVNTHLLDKITEETRASSQYVREEEDIEVKVSNFFAKIRDPVLVNPMLGFTGGIHASKFHPSVLPDLFRGDQLVLAGRYTGEGNSAVIMEGLVRGTTKKFSYDVKFPTVATRDDFIPRLWATRRVGFLLDQIRLHGEDKETKDEVTDLARKYGIVTPYTAYLIVEDEKQRGLASTVQSMPQLNTDSSARQLAQEAYRSFQFESSGQGAVAGAQAAKSLQSAAGGIGGGGFGGGGGRGGRRGGGAGGGRTLDAPGAAMALALTAAAPAINGMAADSGVADRVMQYTEQQQYVNGHTFFLNSGQWIDSEVQKQKDAKRVRVQFGSTEYFDLLRKEPETRAWMALGQNIQFVLKGTVYEVYE